MIVAIPERESATKFTRATPFFVLAVSGSSRPRFVKKNTSTPSGTNVPAGSTRIAVMTDEPPFETTNVGFAISVIVLPGAAVSGTLSQPPSASAPARPAAATSASATTFDRVVIAALRPSCLTASPPAARARAAPAAPCRPRGPPRSTRSRTFPTPA